MADVFFGPLALHLVDRVTETVDTTDILLSPLPDLSTGVISCHERPHSWIQGDDVVFTGIKFSIGLILAKVDLFQL